MHDDEWTKKTLEKLDSKLDIIDARLNNIDITSTKQSMILEEHQRRSLLNEENIELLRTEFKPVEKQVAMANGALKFIGVLSTAASLAYTVFKFFA